MKEIKQVKLDRSARRSLARRFNARKASRYKRNWLGDKILTDFWEIPVEQEGWENCTLIAYRSTRGSVLGTFYHECTSKCPFSKLESEESRGCGVWMMNILGNKPHFQGGFIKPVTWEHKYNREVRKELTKIRSDLRNLLGR